VGRGGARRGRRCLVSLERPLRHAAPRGRGHGSLFLSGARHVAAGHDARGRSLEGALRREALHLLDPPPRHGPALDGREGHAIPFFIAEGLIWTNYVYWQVAGNKREDDYIEQAQLNAGVGVGDGNDDYWKTVGQYSRSSGEGPNSYEEDLRRDARELYPSDPAAQDAYVVENLPTGDKAWEWRTEDLRAQYQDTRDTANDAFHKAKYSFAAALVNRVVSVIDVQLLRKKQRNESRAGELKPETRVYADALDGGGRVVVQRRF
jgi:hypothetical protein